MFIGGAPVSFAPDVFGLNIIQAAAPNGVSGTIDLTTPVTDIAGSLHRLSTEVVSFGALAKDLCRVGASSSLTPLGRGGLRPTSAGLIRPEGRSVGQGSPENADGGHQIRLAREDDAQRSLYRCQY